MIEVGGVHTIIVLLATKRFDAASYLDEVGSTDLYTSCYTISSVKRDDRLQTKRSNPLKTFVKSVIQIPEHVVQNILDRLYSLQIRLTNPMRRHSIDIPKTAFSRIRSQLLSGLQTGLPVKTMLSPLDREIVERIQQKTKLFNQNNVSRTEEYRRLFFSRPELHWAFLAHMVSRNGGWNMTDLKGEMLPRLLDERTRVDYFKFLERCNALIFQDAYPQLLLYEESVKQKANLFHLLPEFHVSAFMKPFWDEFWQRKDSRLLTLALIINEQNYIEQRVVQNFPYRHHVLNTLHFNMQSLLHLTQVILPYHTSSRHVGGLRKLRLAGLHLENFSDLDERIEFGKSLYAILFGVPDVHQGAVDFVKQVPHTGSRADYWPDLFSRSSDSDRPFESGHSIDPDHLSESETLFPSGDVPYGQERLVACTLKQGALKLYSPELENAWEDQLFETPERFDWFRDTAPFKHLTAVRAPLFFDMTDNFCLELNKLELAVLAVENWKR